MRHRWRMYRKSGSCTRPGCGLNYRERKAYRHAGPLAGRVAEIREWRRFMGPWAESRKVPPCEGR